MNINIFGKMDCKYMNISANKYKLLATIRKLSADISSCWNSRFQHSGLSARLLYCTFAEAAFPDSP